MTTVKLFFLSWLLLATVNFDPVYGKLNLETLVTSSLDAADAYMENIADSAPTCARLAKVLVKELREFDNPASDKAWEQATPKVFEEMQRKNVAEGQNIHFGCLRILEKFQKFADSEQSDDAAARVKELAEAVDFFFVITGGSSLCPCASAASTFFKEVTGKPKVWEDFYELKTAMGKAAKHLFDLSTHGGVSPSPHCNEGGMKVMQYYSELTDGKGRPKEKKDEL